MCNPTWPSSSRSAAVNARFALHRFIRIAVRGRKRKGGAAVWKVESHTAAEEEESILRCGVCMLSVYSALCSMCVTQRAIAREQYVQAY